VEESGTGQVDLRPEAHEALGWRGEHAAKGLQAIPPAIGHRDLAIPVIIRDHVRE